MLAFSELGLQEELLSAITEMGFVNPMPIQEKIIPLILNETKDILGLAQTGTGKTAAFGLPLLQGVDSKEKCPSVLILSPTRELCCQIAKDLENYSVHMPEVKVIAVYGGASIETQIKAIKRGVQVVAATPGRLLDLIKRKAIDVSKIENVVLDEADEMLNMGFKDELDGILSNINPDRRTLLFSATMQKEVMRIAEKYMKERVEVSVGEKNTGSDNVSHEYYMVHARDKYLALKRLVDLHPNMYAIIFCRTRIDTQEVSSHLTKDGYDVDALHGDLSQNQRDAVMKKFRDKTLQILVATDVAARGLDVDSLTHVINYSMPDDVEVYTHRSGRTGRAGKTGISVSIIHSRERSKLTQIERTIKKTFVKRNVPSGKEICERQLFNLIDKMQNVTVDNEQIHPYLDKVYEKLASLSREELITKFVSVEFNRFLVYYKDAVDINMHESDARRDSGRDRDRDGGRDRDRGRDREEGRDRGRDRDGGRGRGDRENYVRFFINLGDKDGLIPPRLIGLINEATRNRDIRIGKIEILPQFSFFEVEGEYQNEILRSLKNAEFSGRSVNVEVAQPKSGGGGGGFSGPKPHRKGNKDSDGSVKDVFRKEREQRKSSGGGFDTPKSSSRRRSR